MIEGAFILLIKSLSRAPSFLTEALEKFVEAILEDREPPIPAEDGVRAWKIVGAAYRSARTESPSIFLSFWISSTLRILCFYGDSIPKISRMLEDQGKQLFGKLVKGSSLERLTKWFCRSFRRTFITSLSYFGEA
jgi:hypothetical protein